MNLAIVGCGYVADGYGRTLVNYPTLKLVGVYDRVPKHGLSFGRHFGTHVYSSFDDLLADRSVQLILNLTNPRSHYDVTKRCLAAGKHVYSEKPLAMEYEAACELRDLAVQKGLQLGCAPCSVLSESAQGLGHALADGFVGQVRLVYANFDDGMIAPQMSPWNWKNSLGVPWPARDEFEVGCTYEHAGYVLTWLSAYFGPALRVTAFASCQIPNKGIPVAEMAPDFSVGCIEYSNNVVARVTCSLVAPKDKSLLIVGDRGILSVSDVRNDLCPVYFTPAKGRDRLAEWQRRLNRLTLPFGRFWPIPALGGSKRLPLPRSKQRRFVSDAKLVDFCRGPAEMAAAIDEIRPCRLSADLAVHVVEIVEALQCPKKCDGSRLIASRFASIQPMGAPRD